MYKKIIFLLAYAVLLVLQIKTTNIPQAYEFSAKEIDQQQYRLNSYPPSLARLGHILEAKREAQLVRKLEQNFFTVIDPREYFPSRMPFIASPFVLIGLFIFINERKKREAMFYSFVFSLVFLTFIGPHAKNGPVLIYPYFLLFIVLAFQRIFKQKWI